MGIGRADDNIALNLGVSDLSDDVLIGEADNHPVFGSVVLVLVLNDQTLSGVVIGFALCWAQQSVAGQKTRFLATNLSSS